MEPVEQAAPRPDSSMRGPSIEKPVSVWTYVGSLSLWLFLCIWAAGTLVRQDIHEVKSSLTQYGVTYSDYLDKKMVSNETILKGFSAFFAAVGRTDPDMASRYAMQVIENNPQIFSLEVVQVVKSGQLAEFIAAKKRDGISNFTVKSFSYDSDRKWQPLPEKDVYYPIVFMEPVPAGFDTVLGLDMDSVPFLQRPMNESIKRRTPVASHPFKLVEGNLGYVVFSPISRTLRQPGAARVQDPKDDLLVDMVIDTANLTEAAKFPLFDGETVIIYHKDFGPDDPKGNLLAVTGETRSPIETAIFPAFVFEKSLATLGEPFVLRVKRQVGWSDFSMGLLSLIAGLTLISSLILVAYLRAQQRGRILQLENQQRLWQLANHDALTGLPNRMLLMDRLAQMLARMSRQGKRLAVMFLDVDQFKKINDTYGHESGDQVLKFVAESLVSVVRSDDTVARMSGDEFIILIEHLESGAVSEIVCEKIRQRLADGLSLQGSHVSIHISIGTAVFPDDGELPEALIKLADTRMYEEKARNHRNHAGLYAETPSEVAVGWAAIWR
jgi:diguanylate cyclase (GGDEF)-like protein